MPASRDDLTPKQWCCLLDAVAGKPVAATSDPRRLWRQAADGAVFHLASVLESLLALGLLRRLKRNRYAATPVAICALLRPVQGFQTR